MIDRPSEDDLNMVRAKVPNSQRWEARGQLLTPSKLGLLAKRLSHARDRGEAARLKELLTRGFYGI
jgi:hypothetical protein